MATCNVLFLVASTNQYYVEVIKEEDDTPITDAAVAGTILDLNDTIIDGPVNATNLGEGKYSIVFPASALLINGTQYILSILVVSGANQKTIRQQGEAGYAKT